MSEIIKQSMKNQVYDIIRKKILNQEFKLGEKINIDKLCRNLEISNTPIREAISKLEQEGLLNYRPHMGAYVISPTKREFFEIAQSALFIILGAYDFCVENNVLTELCQELHRELEIQRDYMEKNDRYHFSLYSNSFDRCIIVATENKRLIEDFDHMYYTKMHFMSNACVKEDETAINIFFEQHEQILEAIERREHNKVISLLKVHYYKPYWSEGVGNMPNFQLGIDKT